MTWMDFRSGGVEEIFNGIQRVQALHLSLLDLAMDFFEHGKIPLGDGYPVHREVRGIHTFQGRGPLFLHQVLQMNDEITFIKPDLEDIVVGFPL
jgi:hypothetical protein